MAKYTKRPVTIDAIQLNWANHKAVQDLCFGAPSITFTQASDCSETCGEAAPYLEMVITTLEGDMLAKHGDYIIKGIKGEIYPCKPDIFRETYSLATEEPPAPDFSAVPGASYVIQNG
jgi:hypothetical protein